MITPNWLIFFKGSKSTPLMELVWTNLLEGFALFIYSRDKQIWFRNGVVWERPFCVKRCPQIWVMSRYCYYIPSTIAQVPIVESNFGTSASQSFPAMRGNFWGACAVPGLPECRWRQGNSVRMVCVTLEEGRGSRWHGGFHMLNTSRAYKSFFICCIWMVNVLMILIFLLWTGLPLASGPSRRQGPVSPRMPVSLVPRRSLSIERCTGCSGVRGFQVATN